MQRGQVNFRLEKEELRKLDRVAKAQRRSRTNMAEYLIIKVLRMVDEEGNLPEEQLAAKELRNV